MNDMELAFRRDIIANPADDVPRLIFADWLEDAGRTERAAFIRAQVLDRPEQADLILQVNGHWDCLPFPCYPLVYGLPHANPRFYRMFRRGFVHTVRCELNSWLTHGGPRIVREHPVECVRISDKMPTIGNGGYFFWRSFLSSKATQADCTLPTAVFDLVRNHPRCSFDSVWAMFKTEQDALDALSTACLQYVRNINLPKERP